MTEAPFTFYPFYWLLLVPLIAAVIVFIFSRKLPPSLGIGCMAGVLSWLAYDMMATSALAGWLESQRVYQILFKDFPQDKDRFLSEYESAFRTGGEAAVMRKHEEMKVIMMVNHIPSYIENTPAPIIQQHIVAYTWLLSVLFNKDKTLCQNYLNNSAYFNEVWNQVGDDIFLTSVRFNPLMIVEAVDRPERVSEEDSIKAKSLYRNLRATLRQAGEDMHAKPGEALPCETVYREFYMLTQLPVNDSALIIKFLYSKDHLKDAGEKGLLERFIPLFR